MTLPGVKGKTKFVGKHNFEVRCDGFGTMPDEAVEAYKRERKGRYLIHYMQKIEERLEALEGGK